MSEIGDRGRAKHEPGYRFIFEIWANSWREAMRLYEERAYGEVGKSYEHLPDIPYTDVEFAEQQAFLNARANVR